MRADRAELTRGLRKELGTCRQLGGLLTSSAGQPPNKAAGVRRGSSAGWLGGLLGSGLLNTMGLRGSGLPEEGTATAGEAHGAGLASSKKELDLSA